MLPQSPQLAKQLLMVAGVDRYYQIARCLRDEDLRADRQFEFSQLDVEASFVAQEDVLEFVSEAVLDAAEAVTGERPGRHPADDLGRGHRPVRHRQARPPLRHGAGRPVGGVRGHRGQGVRRAVREGHRASRAAPASPGPGSTGSPTGPRQLGAKGLAWFRVTAGEGGGPALDSPLDRFLSDAERAGLLAATGASPGDLVLVVADEYRLACTVLGHLRVELGGRPVSEGPYRYLWVVDFPLFDGVDDAGHPVAAHHPFTMPHPDDLDRLETDPASVRSQAYDLVLNGWELGSGSVRIHRADIQSRVFAVLGIGEEEAESRFGFLLGAFRYGAPPHAGFAVGIDRLVAIFAGEDSIREVIAFPKTQSGSDPMTGAPKPLAPGVLADLGLRPIPPAD